MRNSTWMMRRKETTWWHWNFNRKILIAFIIWAFTTRGNLTMKEPLIALMSSSNKTPGSRPFTTLLASFMTNSKTMKNPVKNSLKLSNSIAKMPFFTITEDAVTKTWVSTKNQSKTLNKLWLTTLPIQLPIRILESFIEKCKDLNRRLSIFQRK